MLILPTSKASSPLPNSSFSGDCNTLSPRFGRSGCVLSKRADLALWSGDPLEVGSVAVQVWFDGRPIPMESRQTELRDRYLRAAGEPGQGALPRAYPGL